MHEHKGVAIPLQNAVIKLLQTYWNALQENL